MMVVFVVMVVGVVGGVFVVADAARSIDVRRGSTRRDWRPVRRRVLVAVACGGPAWAATGWPVAGIGIGVVGWFWTELFGSKAARDVITARTEAIATWTEMLRDTISGAHGLEEAISTSSTVAPAAIATEVIALSVRLERQPLSDALGAFAADLAHPTGDLVVASLRLAADGAVGDLADLLGTLATAARDEAGMRLRIEATRARLRTSVRVIAGCTAGMAVGLALLNRQYLGVYATLTGQLVLAVIAVVWGISLHWLSRMGEFVAPERFLADAPAMGAP